MADRFSAAMLLLTESPAQATIVGVVICLCANVVISLALNCQKLAHTRLQQQQREAGGADEAERGSEGENAKQGSAEAREPSLALSPTAQHESAQRTPQGDNVLGIVVVVDKDAAEQRARNENLPLLSPQQTRDGSKYGAAGRGADAEQASGSTSASGTLRGEGGGKTPASSSDDEASEEEHQGPTTQFLRSKLWWLGFGLMVLGESGNFLSYGFAPASLVAPLGAVALLSNVIISPFLLKERFQASDLFGIFLCIVGAVTVVFASRDSDVRLGPDGLLHAIMRKEFVAYSITACALGAILASMSRTKWGERFVLIDIGVCAIFGGFTVLSTKGISSLLSGGRPLELLSFPITYALIVVLAGTAVLQLTYLNRALQRFDSREVIYVLFTLSAIIGAAILFRDFEDVDPHRLINFFFGVAALFGGVFVLTRQHESSEDSHDEESQSDESHSASPERIPVSMTLPPVDERHEESTPAAAARLQIAAPSSAERRAGRLMRPGLSGTVSSGTQGGDAGAGALGTSATSQASAPWSTSKTPRRNIVGLAPASGGLSQGTYLLLAATSPAKPGGMTQPSGGALSGSASASRPSRGRSSSQPNTPTRRRSRMNLRADDAAQQQEAEATPSVDAAARRAARQRSPDAAAGARRPATERSATTTTTTTQREGALDEDMPWASSAADQSRNTAS